MRCPNAGRLAGRINLQIVLTFGKPCGCHFQPGGLGTEWAGPHKMRPGKKQTHQQEFTRKREREGGGGDGDGERVEKGDVESI